MQHEIEKDEAKFEFKPKDDIFAVASLLKITQSPIRQTGVMTSYTVIPQRTAGAGFQVPAPR